METTPRDLYVLVQEDPEGLDNDAELTGVFTSESAARAHADEHESEPIVWGFNPADGVEDENFGSTGGSGLGWRVYRVPNFC
jgi:hypothetical protein